MINRLKSIIDLTKSLSLSRQMYFDNGIVYTVDKDQLFLAYTDIREDKNTVKLGLDKMRFNINIDKFLLFEKEYKKSYKDFIYDEKTLTLETNIPNIKFCTEEINKKQVDLFSELFKKFEDNEIKFQASFTESNKIDLLKNNVIRFYCNLKDNKIYFSEPNDIKNYIMISVIASKLPKIVKDTKDLKITLYLEDKSVYIFKLEIINKSFKTVMYGLTVKAEED